MSKRSARSDLPAGMVAGLAIDVAAAAAGISAEPPEWLKISPKGTFTCRDGRTYTLEPDAVMTRFSADGAHVPIDKGHEIVRDNAAPALGWIGELEARSDGLYGRVEWLQGGKDLLAARTHRYVSPAFHHDDQNRATWLHSVALVAAPALARMPAVASAGGHHQEQTMKGVATALGLADSADEAACLAAIHSGFVPRAVHEEIVARLSAVSAELQSERGERRAEKVDGLIEGALKAIKIVPAERAHYVALCATPVGLETVEKLFASMTAKIMPSILEERQVPLGARPRTAETLAAETNKLLKKRADEGLPLIGYADAMSLVIQNSPLD